MTEGTRWMRNALLMAVLMVAGLTFACGGPVRTVVLGSISALLFHPPSDRDEFFHIVAVNFQRPDFCERIAWRADGSRGAWDSPFEIRTLRSACRSDLNPPPNAIGGKVPFWMAEFAAQVRSLGYTDADLVQGAYAEGRHRESYEGLLASEEFRTRLRAAPSYGEPRDPARLRPAKPIEFMYQMVAVDAPEAPLCSKVSPNATFEALGGAVRLLQSWCYLHIGYNTRDLRMCEPLPSAGSFPHINEIYDSREKCRQVVAIYSRPDFKGTLNYGSAHFPQAADLQAILREIGYPADKWPPVPETTPEDYWEFVSRLIHRGNASDRAEFLRRVEALR
jgi:hypothetical protein